MTMNQILNPTNGKVAAHKMEIKIGKIHKNMIVIINMEIGTKIDFSYFLF